MYSYPVDMTHSADVTGFFDPDTGTVSYVVRDPDSKRCAIVDPVMDLDYAAGRITGDSADALIGHVRDHGLELEWLLETHVHADHLSAAPYIQERLGGRIAIGAHITTVQQTFGAVFNAGDEFARDGSQFDHLFADGEACSIGGLPGFAMHTPGHTPACMTYVFGDAAFVGDTVFMPDGGTARSDFPGGDAATLYHSIAKLLSLPDAMRLFVCHDYQPEGRPLRFETSVARQKSCNIHVRDGVGEQDFVRMRTRRDADLPMPRLIIPSIQVNMRAGHLPPAESDGTRFLKVPVNRL